MSALTAAGEICLPRDGSEATELDLADFLQQRWGMPVSYVITAYNDMAKIRDPAGGEALLIGIEAFIPPRASIAAGHSLVDVGYGRLAGQRHPMSFRANNNRRRSLEQR